MTFDDFLPHVIPYVPGCPELVALEHIKRAAREFCERTELWQVDTQPLLTSPGLATYPLDLDDEQERVKLRRVWVDGHEYRVVDSMLGHALTRRGYGTFAYLEGPLDLMLFPVPTADALEITTQMVVKPSLAAEDWPDDFAEYVHDISHGAIATLARLPKSTWADRQLAIDERAQFEDRIQTVGFKVSQSFTGRPPSRKSRFL